MITAPPTPVPTQTATRRSAPRPAPTRASASAASRTSFSMRPAAPGNAAPTAFTAFQFEAFRFAALRSVPFDVSTAPGAAIAKDVTSVRAAPASLSARSEASTRARPIASGPSANGVLSLPRPRMRFEASTTPARIFVPPRSMPRARPFAFGFAMGRRVYVPFGRIGDHCAGRLLQCPLTTGPAPRPSRSTCPRSLSRSTSRRRASRTTR